MMHDDNLEALIWRDIKNCPAALISPGGSTALPHGRSVVAVVRELLPAESRCHFVPKTSRLLIEQNSIVLVGLLDEFPEDALRLARLGGYPGRFEFCLAGAMPGIRDTRAAPEEAVVTTTERHVGLVLRGTGSDLARTQVLLLTGTTPLGVYIAAFWATNLAHIVVAAPEAFPASPLEAVITTDALRAFEIAPNNLTPLRLACGDLDYDQTAHEWISKERLTPVRVEISGGTVKSIAVCGSPIVRGGDLAKLLLVLIQRTKKGLWTTIGEAQRILDAVENPKRHGTLEARLSEIRKLSPHKGFVEMQPGSTGQEPSFRLRADIRFVDVPRAPEE